MILPALVLWSELALPGPSPAPSPAPSPEPIPERVPHVSWLPTVTLRVTHRGRWTAWSDAPGDLGSVPYGTTVEVRLEWTFGRPTAATSAGASTEEP